MKFRTTAACRICGDAQPGKYSLLCANCYRNADNQKRKYGITLEDAVKQIRERREFKKNPFCKRCGAVGGPHQLYIFKDRLCLDCYITERNKKSPALSDKTEQEGRGATPP